MAKEVPLKISTFLDQVAINVYLDAIPKVPAAPIKLAFYALDERYTFLEIFNEWKPEEYKETSLEKMSETDKYVLYKFNIELPDKFLIKCPKCKGEFSKADLIPGSEKEMVYFLNIKGAPFAIVISNSHFEESDYTFSFFNKYYPFMTRIVLRAQQIQEILNGIEGKNIFTGYLYSQDFILKRYYAGKETERHFKKRDFKSIFEEAKSKGLWLDNITFRAETKGRIQLSREGKVQYYDDFLFSDLLDLIDLIIESYLKSYHLVKSAELQRKEGKMSSVKIILNEETFAENEDADFFISYLQKYKDSDLTLLSRNGAFFESTLIDYKTGSSIDVCIYDSRIITIIPQFQTNLIALINLIGYIQEDFDGKIEV